MRLDLLIASVSAGVLVYSGRLLAPTSRLRPEDIISYRHPSGLVYSIADPFGAGPAPWPVFPENDIVLKIREVLDGKVGFDLERSGACSRSSRGLSRFPGTSRLS